MKIVLTGASGLLGSAFARSASRRGHHVVGVVGQFAHDIAGLEETARIDLRALDAVEAFVLESFPDAIVNCAAISDPGACQQDLATSRRLNVELPEKLALLSRHLFATLVHISSEQVFDGHVEIYLPDSQPCPPNEYAKQKLESEKRVHDLAAEFATTLRLPLLTGNSPSGERSFHERLFLAWERGEPTKLFSDEIRQPCLSDNAADLMVELCERNDLKGVRNWAGETALSRYEMGQALLRHFGLPETLVEIATRGDDPKFAHRQPRLAFDLSSLSGKTKTQPQTYSEQLDSLVVPAPRRQWYNAL